MQAENVTENMNIIEWLGHNWGIVGFGIAAIMKFAQDHLRIKTLESRMNKLEEKTEVQTEILLRLDVKTDYLVKTVDDNTSDIKNIHKGR